MAITVKHKFVSAIPDAGDTTVVQPSNWNDDHQLTGTVPIANGGTGASDAPTALTNLGAYPASNPSGYGTGTVTSVAATVPSFLSVTGSPITTSGTLALTYSGTALPVANGGTGVTSSSGANSVVLRDANGNITTNCLFEGFSSQAASGTTITLTASSAQNLLITGSGGQTIKLPNATTLPNGALFTFNNNQSSGAITVVNNSSTTIATINAGGYVTVVLLDNSIAAGSWDRHDSTPSNVSWSTNTLDFPGSITSATWNGTAVAINRGGTGQSTASAAFNALSPLTTAGDTLYGGTSGAGTRLAIGTAGQVLTVNSGATAPQWSTPTTGTVTSVSGTGSVNGITLTGTVTSSGSLTLGGTLGSIANSQLTNSAITINGTSTSLGGSISVGTVTSVAALTLGTTGTDLSSSVATGTTTPVITLNVPTASASNRGALSAADWTTFNNKGSGTVTSITAGTGLSGGTITGSGTIAIDSTVTTLTGTQTLTNKTLTNPTITNYTETLYSPSAGSTFTVALTDGTVQKLTTNANTTVTLPSSVSGKSFIIIIAYGGSHSITWAGGSTIKWAGGFAPTATAVNGKFDIFTFFQDGTNTYASVLGQNY